MPFKKGDPKPPTSGRKAGTPNKASAEFKAWCARVATLETVRAEAEKQILEGRIDLMFKAAEHAFGKPTQSVDLSGRVDGTLVLDRDVSEE
jgi:hypothetical protein